MTQDLTPFGPRRMTPKQFEEEFGMPSPGVGETVPLEMGREDARRFEDSVRQAAQPPATIAGQATRSTHGNVAPPQPSLMDEIADLDRNRGSRRGREQKHPVRRALGVAVVAAVASIPIAGGVAVAQNRDKIHSFQDAFEIGGSGAIEFVVNAFDTVL